MFPFIQKNVPAWQLSRCPFEKPGDEKEIQGKQLPSETNEARELCKVCFL